MVSEWLISLCFLCLKPSCFQYSDVLDNLDAEIERVLRRGLGRVSLNEIRESSREMDRIRGEMAKVRAKVSKDVGGPTVQ